MEQINRARNGGWVEGRLKIILGRARAKKGMFEGDLEDGELEIGQISGYINEIKPAADIVVEIIAEYTSALQKLRPI